MTASADRSAQQPVERFRPTSGRVVGYGSLAVIAGLLVYLMVDVRSLTGLRVGTGLAFLAVLVWVTQLRPSAAAYPEVLTLRSSLRDTTVPLAAIDSVDVRRTLNVRVGAERFVCVGIGRSLRSMVKVKSRGPSSMLGWDRLEAYTEEATPLRPDQTETTYADFVESRIGGLAEDARRRGAEAGEARHDWAWPEIAALAVTGAAFVVSLLL